MTKYKNKSLRAWSHNGLRGHAIFARKCMSAITQSDTVTPAARELAARINNDLAQLSIELQTRVDGDS